MDKSSENAAIGVLVSTAFAIAATIIGVNDGDNPCQTNDADITLQTWLLVYAGTFYLIVFAVLLMFFVQNDSFVQGMTFLLTMIVLFALSWMITGAVILATQHKKCLHDGEPIGIMTISILGYSALSFVVKFFSR